MHNMIQSFWLTFIAIFVALDIIGTLPLYLSITHKMDPIQKRNTLDTSMGVAFAVALAFIFLGRLIFKALGITLFDFKIAGGIVLLLISLADLVNQPEVTKRASGSTGIVPLAVPLITGPAVLTTLLLQVSNVGYWITFTAMLSNYLLAWILLRKSEIITRFIGKDGTVVVSKIAALLLAAISIAMIRTGVFEAIQNFY